MATSANHRTNILQFVIALAYATTTTSSSSSTNAAETASSSPYFPPDLIPLIASYLTTLHGFFALRAACRTYRALLPTSPANLASQLPLLLVTHKASVSEALFHAPLRRLLRFRLPCTRLDGRDPSYTRFYSFGWRVAIEDRNAHGRHRDLRICHLLTGERARLPAHPNEFKGVIFSGDLVITFDLRSHVLHYCRIGDAKWRAAFCDEDYRIYNLMFVKGTLYALIYPNYRLAVVELHNNSMELSFLGDKSSARTVQKSTMSWLAECRGELLLVVPVQCSPPVYHVFCWQSEERKWARTTNLGGCSLFFNRHQFAGWLGPDHPAVRRDCMYFTCLYGEWGKYSLVDGYWHERVVDYPGLGSPLAWVLPSIG
jgi:hypothetical protein